MLRDSWAERNAGHHVEQLEIVFLPGEWRERVAAAWAETVARTEALRIAFVLDAGEAVGAEFASSPPQLQLEQSAPVSWEAWLAADRCRPLLVPHEVPWRAVYWPRDGRFLWTFHHALLDGRSIAAVLRGFLVRVGGGQAEALGLSKWKEPCPAAIVRAGKLFQEEFSQGPTTAYQIPEDGAEDGYALEWMGADFRKKLESLAWKMELTAATVLIWAWGQALARAFATDAVVVEQVRCGAPQPGTAGFVMHTLPVMIRRAADAETEVALRGFRAWLLALREIEGVSEGDFPSGVFPDVEQAWSSVIMVEYGTLRHLAGGEMVVALELHECKGETLMATAHVLPDLRLQVEGPGRHDLLKRWIAVLERLVVARSNPDDCEFAPPRACGGDDGAI